jgi:hypothetical protein
LFELSQAFYVSRFGRRDNELFEGIKKARSILVRRGDDGNARVLGRSYLAASVDQPALHERVCCFVLSVVFFFPLLLARFDA